MSVKNICLPVNEEFEIVANSDFFAMEEIMLRFPHLAEALFTSLNYVWKPERLQRNYIADHGTIVDYFSTYYL